MGPQPDPQCIFKHKFKQFSGRLLASATRLPSTTQSPIQATLKPVPIAHCRPQVSLFRNRSIKWFGRPCLSFMVFAGCTSTQTSPQRQTLNSLPALPPPPQSPQITQSPQPVELTPIQAILAAAEKEEGVTGVFRFEVKGAGRQGGLLYLRSETDYRDQRCLTLALMPPAAQALEAALGQDPVVAMKGKSIRATGTAQRITIWFFSNGIRTDKYYYQTQIRIRDISQVRILP